METRIYHPASSIPRSLVYRLTTQDSTIDALLDSGADVSLLSEETARKRGISLEPLERPYMVRLANQTTVRVTSCVSSLPLARGKWTDEVWCLVVPSLT